MITDSFRKMYHDKEHPKKVRKQKERIPKTECFY